MKHQWIAWCTLCGWYMTEYTPRRAETAAYAHTRLQPHPATSFGRAVYA